MVLMHRQKNLCSKLQILRELLNFEFGARLESGLCGRVGSIGPAMQKVDEWSWCQPEPRRWSLKLFLVLTFSFPLDLTVELILTTKSNSLYQTLLNLSLLNVHLYWIEWVEREVSLWSQSWRPWLFPIRCVDSVYFEANFEYYWRANSYPMVSFTGASAVKRYRKFLLSSGV